MHNFWSLSLLFWCFLLQAECLQDENLVLSLHKMKQELDMTRKELKTLKDYVLSEDRETENKAPPVGFVYMQLPRQPPPTEIWEETVWEDITWSYAGRFFRALGGGSAGWGTAQEENAPRLTNVHSRLERANHGSEIRGVSIPKGGQSSWIWTGDDIGGYPASLLQTSFSASGGEVRPKNYGVKLWRRV